MLLWKKLTLKSETVFKPLIDQRQYKFITLENGIEALLVQDPEAIEAAHLCQVGVGYYQDPDELAGLAHFTEHMVLKGSTSRNTSLKVFVSEFNGMNNGFTMAETTNYLYQIPNEHLEESVDFTGEMVQDPLIDKQIFEKEVNAVNNEHEKNFQEISRRVYSYSKYLAAENHPFHKFATGNLLTLVEQPEHQSINPHEEMLNFIKTYYYARNTRLILIGNYELSLLQQWVENSYSNMIEYPATSQQPKKAMGKSRTTAQISAFGQLEKGNMVYFQPVIKEDKDLFIIFPIEDKELCDDEETGAIPYIMSFINRKHKGSLFNILSNEKQLITNLQSYFGGKHSQFLAYAQIKFSLTDLGYENIEEILQITYSYFTFLSQNIVQKEVYQKEGLNAFKNFNFFTQKQAWDSIMDLAFRYDQNLSKKNFLLAESTFYRFDKKLISRAFDLFKPDQANYFVSSSSFQVPEDQNSNEFLKIQKKKQNQSKDIHPFIFKAGKFVQNQLFLQSIKEIFLKDDEDIILSESLPYDSNYKFLTRKIPNDVLKELENDYEQKNEFQLYCQQIDTQNHEMNHEIQQVRQNFLNQIPNIESLQLLNNCNDNKQQGQDFNDQLTSYYNNLSNGNFQDQKTMFKKLQEEFNNDCLNNEIQKDSLSEEPTEIVTSKNLNIIHKLDRSFKQPAIYLSLTFVYQNADQYPNVFYSLAAQILNNDVQENLNYSRNSLVKFQPFSRTFKIVIFNLQDEFLDFSIQVVQQAKRSMGMLDQKKFDNAKMQVIKKLQLEDGTQPYQLGLQVYKQFLKQTIDPSPKEQINTLDELDYEEYGDFWYNIIQSQNYKIFTYVTGNIEENDSIILTETLVELFGNDNDQSNELSNSQVSEDEITIQDSSQVIRITNNNPDDINSAIINYYEVGERNIHNQASLILIKDILKTQAYEFLRTEHQLGYITNCQVVNNNKAVGIIALVQGSKLPPHEMDILIEEYLFVFEQYLVSMTDQEFKTLKQTKIDILIKKDISILDRASKVGQKIVKYQDYDINQQLAEEIETLSKSQLLDFYRSSFKEKGDKLSIQIYSEQYGSDLPDILLTSEQTYSSRTPELYENMEEFDFVQLF